MPETPPSLPNPNKLRRDLGLLAVLLLVAVGLRSWQIAHTEVAARDSIGFIRQAWRLQEQPLMDVVRSSEQHPGYPIMIVAVSWPVRSIVSGSNAATMQLSAQLTSAIAGVLLVFPMFFLGKALFNRSVGFWAALLFQVLPTSSRVLADGLSEGTFLLFAATGLWLGVIALRGQSKLLFGAAGLAGGLAYLTRPEGAAVVAATGMVLLGMQLKTAWRRPWVQLAACAIWLLAGWALLGGPFMAVTGRFTIKNTGIQIMEVAKVESTAPMPPDQKEPSVKIDLPQVSWFNQAWESRWMWGARKLGAELLKGFFYVAWVPALLALWWFRRRFARSPGQWVLLLVSVAMLLVLFRVATFMRYLSDRHALLLILCGCFWSAAGFLAIGRRFADLFRTWSESQAQTRKPLFAFGWSLVRDPRFWSGLLLVSLTCATVYKNLEPLHANRQGFRDAGRWIAEHADASDEVYDPYCWTHYYAGRVFLEASPVDIPAGHERVRYVVLEESGNEHPRLPIVPQAKMMAQTGLKVFECKARRKKEICDVSVYAVPIKP
jgi:4-amino-4-deoxy-L-arabinose transferase-like glycosyltransferase